MSKEIKKTMEELQNMASFKDFGKGKKSGMYGEMPKIKIGKFTISDMSDDEGCKSVWIEDTENGDGGEFNKSTLADFIGNYYSEYF
jgi:hypothetical protein